MQYRTTAQFEEIVESCLNGNWSQAAAECVEYGYYANDLINKQNESDGMGFQDLTDIALVAEMAAKLR